ncbi:MAG: hypothetical protein BMS9Abin36_0962 [Gammaproteobacteria bacterium]|nr:MAG: hypothetical protein BMS9Abin36_0962 [Gammaproteobacteria bacterium]
MAAPTAFRHFNSLGSFKTISHDKAEYQLELVKD